MRTRWEKVVGDGSLSIEDAPCPRFRPGIRYTFLLLIRGRYTSRTEVHQLGLLRRGRRPVGLSGSFRGRLWAFPYPLLRP